MQLLLSSRPQSSLPTKRPPALRIHTSSSSSDLPSKNMKGLSLNISSPSTDSPLSSLPGDSPRVRTRPLSVVSLPNPSVSTLLHRGEENASPSVPYLDGPTQIIPGVWLGSEDNARDWDTLAGLGINSILNVAKEVISPFDSVAPQPLQNLNEKTISQHNSTYYPAHHPTGRPAMYYLKLHWSHGQQDLVPDGFPAGMAFVDATRKRGDAVLIHCQCGISRSATMVIALVMRAASMSSPSVPPQVWALKGMQAAYSYVKEKSKWVGPNMSLIYQLLEYERTLQGNISPPLSENSFPTTDEEEEWGRLRQKMDEDSDGTDHDDRESIEILREARALDKAMEDRIVARKSSLSSIGSSGIGMGAAWRSRYGSNRKRTGSIASNLTNGSMLSEDLVEEDEEQALLHVGGGFDDTSDTRSAEAEVSSTSSDSHGDGEFSTDQTVPFTPVTARPPPSAPAFRSSFAIQTLVPPATAIKSSFDLPSRPSKLKAKRRPPPLGLLPPVPPSPITLDIPDPTPSTFPTRARTESRKPAMPPLHLRHPQKVSSYASLKPTLSAAATPSQTLFVFPPSPTLTTRTPSTMTLTSNLNAPAVLFPSMPPPRVSTTRSHGRTRSFIGLGAPPTPTIACSRVDARGWIGLE